MNFHKRQKHFLQESIKNSYDDMSVFDIMGRTIDAMQNSLEAYKIAGYSPDIIIDIPHNACGFYEFNRTYELIELGRMIAKESLGENR